MQDFTATYDPADNKIRIRATSRLPKDLYDRVRAHGFIWAPKQELFVAPMWTPEREDLALELAGEIGDEDTSLVDRAEQRAERFGDYSESRKEDAAQAHAAVHSICDGIPLGQPILVGHHSERHARKDAERIENGMRRAVKMWDTAQYWQSRATGALRLAKYKERPDVRGRRIKGIEADKRKKERTKAEYEKCLRFWNGELKLRNPATGESRPLEITEENKATIAHVLGNSSDFGYLPVIKQADGSGDWHAYDVLRPDEERYKACPACTVAQCQEAARRLYPQWIERCNRWLNHYANRISYERAMLDEGGGLVGEKIATQYEVGGRVNILRYGWSLIVRVNRRAGVVMSLTIAGVGWRSIGLEEVQGYQAPSAEDNAKVKAVTKTPPLCNYPGEGFLHQTKEEWEKTVPQWSDFPKYITVKGTETAGKHRVRNQCETGKEYYKTKPVFLTDSKRVDPPAATAPVKLAPFVPPPDEDEPAPVATPKAENPEEAKFDAMRDSLKAGVQVVTAPQLFPTPADLAARMVETAFENGWGVQIGAEMNLKCRVLEPSAGTGNILAAIGQASKEHRACGFELVAVEINLNLAHALAAKFPVADVRRTDFLTCNGDLGKFDRIVMNPPFERGSDIEHIRHAVGMLADGGRLVAICASGPKQREALEPLCDSWTDLEPGTFKESGTMVNVAMIVINK